MFDHVTVGPLLENFLVLGFLVAGGWLVVSAWVSLGAHKSHK